MPPLEVEFSSRFRSEVVELPTERQDQVAQATALLSAAFGQPHRHGGLGIRRLQGSYFEFRVGRDMRVVFRLEGSIATLKMVGDHNAVRRFLKSL